MMNTYNPDAYAPPGWTIQEEIELRGMSQRALATALDVSTKHINELIKGKASLSIETAMGLENVLGIPARLWMALESQYQLKEAEKRERKILKQQVDILKKYPLSQMQKHGWMEKHADKVDMLSELMRFFSVNNPTKLNFAGSTGTLFRQTGKREIDPYAVKVWLQKGLIDGIQMQCSPYNKEEFKATLGEIRKLTQKFPQDFESQLKSLCAASGVAVVFTRELPNTGLCGAARWLAPEKALIQLSLRYKTNDHFWFAFFHEACHILKHNKTNPFVEYQKNIIPDDSNYDKNIEAEADKFAGDLLIPPMEYQHFVEIYDFTPNSINKFARHISVHPGIVVGRLQHDGLIPFSRLNNLKMKLAWAES